LHGLLKQWCGETTYFQVLSMFDLRKSNLENEKYSRKVFTKFERKKVFKNMTPAWRTEYAKAAIRF